MRLFKQKILSLVTAVCMIATSAAPVFAAERATGDVTDSGSIKVTWQGDVTSVKVTLDSGDPTTVETFSSTNTTRENLPVGDYLVEVTTPTSVTSVKVNTTEGYESNNNSDALVWTKADAKYELQTGATLELNIVATSGGGGDSPTAIDSVQLKKGGTAFDGEAIIVGESLTGVALDGQSNEIADNVTYQWQESAAKDNGYTDINGATNVTYTPDKNKIGKWIRVKATGDGTAVTSTKESAAVQVNAKTFTVKLSKSAPSADDILEVTTNPTDAATGATYEWYHGASTDNLTKIEGSAAATLTLTDYEGQFIKVVATGAGDYKGETANATTASAVSAAGTVNAQAPNITTDLNVAEVIYDKDETADDLSVTATSPDNGLLSYQWYSNTTGTIDTISDTPVGTDSNTFTPPTTTAGTIYYYVVVTNTIDTPNGTPTATTTSQLAMITVKEAVTVSATPTFRTDLASTMAVVVDDTLALTVEAEASDGGNLSYAWYKDGSKLADVTNAYTKANVTADDAGSYYVVVTNTNGALASATAQSTVCVVTVNQKADIAQEIIDAGITDVTVPAGQVPTGATLNVESKDKPPTLSTDISKEINSNPDIILINMSSAISMEISLKRPDGSTVQPDGGQIDITMKKPKGFGRYIMAIHYPTGSNTPKFVIAKVTDDDQIFFTLNGLSPVVLAEYTPKTPTPPTPNPNPDNGNNNNSGGSGGGGGGGGGSSGSNKSQSIFQRTTSTINNILKGWFGGVSRKTTTSATGAAAVTGTPVTESAAAKAASSAASQAKAQGSNSFNAIVRNATTVSPKAFEAVASQAQKSGLKGYLAADTMKNGAVDVRVSVLASAASRLGKELNMYAVCGNPAIEKHFNKYFSNKTAVISMSQKGSFGVTVNVAAKVNLNGMDVKNLHIYSYDVASNSYRELPQEACFVDGNGYLHFTTDMGGYIVISDGVLTLH